MRSLFGVKGWINDVTLRDPRHKDLHELLLDLSRPGLCLVLGAGASHGVIPMTPRQIAEVARELVEAKGNRSALTGTYLDQIQHPLVISLTDMLRRIDRGAWDRVIPQFLTPGQATFVLNEVFAPRGVVPSSMVRIYEVLENKRGSIVSYNYDRITDGQDRFQVIAPHGQRSQLLANQRTYNTAKKMALEFNVSIPTDLWLPVPETEAIRVRRCYREAVLAWRRAASIVFVGYGFGSGSDAFSFEDFGANASPLARIHVLNPRPDNADLCKQVEHAVRGRRLGFRVHRQPYRWQPFTQALLEVLDSIRANHVRSAIGRESEIGTRHDELQTDPLA